MAPSATTPAPRPAPRLSRERRVSPRGVVNSTIVHGSPAPHDRPDGATVAGCLGAIRRLYPSAPRMSIVNLHIPAIYATCAIRAMFAKPQVRRGHASGVLDTRCNQDLERRTRRTRGVRQPSTRHAAAVARHADRSGDEQPPAATSARTPASASANRPPAIPARIAAPTADASGTRGRAELAAADVGLQLVPRRAARLAVDQRELLDAHPLLGEDLQDRRIQVGDALQDRPNEVPATVMAGDAQERRSGMGYLGQGGAVRVRVAQQAVRARGDSRRPPRSAPRTRRSPLRGCQGVAEPAEQGPGADRDHLVEVHSGTTWRATHRRPRGSRRGSWVTARHASEDPVPRVSSPGASTPLPSVAAWSSPPPRGHDCRRRQPRVAAGLRSRVPLPRPVPDRRQDPGRDLCGLAQLGGPVVRPPVVEQAARQAAPVRLGCPRESPEDVVLGRHGAPHRPPHLGAVAPGPVQVGQHEPRGRRHAADVDDPVAADGVEDRRRARGVALVRPVDRGREHAIPLVQQHDRVALAHHAQRGDTGSVDAPRPRGGRAPLRRARRTSRVDRSLPNPGAADASGTAARQRPGRPTPDRPGRP